MAKRNQYGRTKSQQRKVDQLRAEGKVVPIGLFGLALTAEEVAQKMAHGRSGAAGAHGNPKARRDRVPTGKRVGSRSARQASAIRDAS